MRTREFKKHKSLFNYAESITIIMEREIRKIYGSDAHTMYAIMILNGTLFNANFMAL
jgi:hypothetical protein